MLQITLTMVLLAWVIIETKQDLLPETRNQQCLCCNNKYITEYDNYWLAVKSQQLYT